MGIPSELAVGAALTQRAQGRFWPARLDFLQSASGLFLALFLWVHLFAEASILLGKDAMYRVTLFFEGYYVFGTPYPIIITLFSLFILTFVVLHAVLAVRKIPVTYRQYRVYRDHQKLLRHEDTTLWWVQVYTGFALFFLLSGSADIKPGHTETGIASFYHDRFQGRKTASGQRFDQNDYSAAHRTLAFGTIVRVTRAGSGKSVVVTINDRGPFKAGRVIDLSRQAARDLGMIGKGLVRVRVEVIRPPRRGI